MRASQLIETSLRSKLKKYGKNSFFSVVVAYWTGKFNYIFVSWFGFSKVFFSFKNSNYFIKEHFHVSANNNAYQRKIPTYIAQKQQQKLFMRYLFRLFPLPNCPLPLLYFPRYIVSYCKFPSSQLCIILTPPSLPYTRSADTSTTFCSYIGRVGERLSPTPTPSNQISQTKTFQPPTCLSLPHFP